MVVQFPDPPAVQYLNAADPDQPLTVQPPRAVGHFEFIAQLEGQTESVKFEVIGPSQQYMPLPSIPGEPLPGTCTPGSPPEGNLGMCPQPTAAQASNHRIACCTALQVCGTGVEDTGLCN